MDRTREKQLAKAPYDWLRISPVVTIPTLWGILSLNFGTFCNSCSYETSNMISYATGVLGSALWHLLLLQYINNKESEIIQHHGRLALTNAGVRTGVALLTMIIASFPGNEGLICVGAILLIVIWLVNFNNGFQLVEKDFANEEDESPPVAEKINEDVIENQLAATELLSTEEKMDMSNGQSAQQMLDQILSDLKSKTDSEKMKALETLKGLKFGSEAIRLQLEHLAIHDSNSVIRKSALDALDAPTQRFVRSTSNKLTKHERNTFLEELNRLVKDNLLLSTVADVIRKRYDFDITPQPEPKPVSVQQAVSQPKPQIQQPTHKPVTETPVEQPKPKEPEGPRPTLMQALLSETSIKIALYLGAFFVIASALILAVAVPAARLPILIVATIIFGSVSVAIRKRLPQPSFALFIVFSFLLPITAKVIEDYIPFSFAGKGAYWMAVSFLMAGIWAASTWLYNSRFFSVVSFASIAVGFYRAGDIFDATPEMYTTLVGISTFSGLIGTQILKKWRDTQFFLPLFIAAQILQIAVLATTVSVFSFGLFNNSSPNIWNLALAFTWIAAFAFFVLSNLIYSFVLFPWLAAGVLFMIPVYVSTAFNFSSLGFSLLFGAWAVPLALVSEITHRFEKIKSYSLPLLLVSIPTSMVATISGFIDSTTTGMLMAFGVALLYSAVQLARPRGWLWAYGLLNFIVGYFAFFTLPAVAKLDVFFGYQLLGLSIIFLLPDLILKNDFKDSPHWRVSPRIYGTLFTISGFLAYATSSSKPIHIAIVFLVYAIFFAMYALRYNQALIGYVPTTAFALFTIYILNHFELDLWSYVLTILSIAYFFGGFALHKNENRSSWRTMLEVSGLVLGTLTSFMAVASLEKSSGWFIAIIGLLYIVEMYSRRQNLFEIGAQVLFAVAAFSILNDFNVHEASSLLMVLTFTTLTLDMVFSRTFDEKRILNLPIKVIGAILAFAATLLILNQTDKYAATAFGILTIFFVIYTLVQRNALYGYVSAAYLPLTIYFTLEMFKVDVWLPVLTGLAVLYFVVHVAIRSTGKWSEMFRNSSLALGTIISFIALLTLKSNSGWYPLVIGLLFAAEMYLQKDGVYEVGIPIMFNIGAFLILRDFKIDELAYHMLAYSLVWLLTDVIAHLTFANPRLLKELVRGVGGLLAMINYPILFFSGTATDSSTAILGFGIYTLLFLTISLLYRQPLLLYTFTLTLPLFDAFLFRGLGITKWIHPVIVIAVIYYVIGYLFRRASRFKDWDHTLLFSGLGLGIIVSCAAPILGGLDAAIPVAAAATLWAIEAFARKNVWLGFPTNTLYLLAYFIVLFGLDTTEIQFFSMGAALLGMLQHYLLVRAGSKTGAFLTGMVSQLILLGTTYIEWINKSLLIYFFVLLFQSLVVLAYGVISRSRSLTFTPIVIVVLGTITLLYSQFKDINTVIIIGCTGIVMLVFGILAVIMRERITKLGERLSTWNA